MRTILFLTLTITAVFSQNCGLPTPYCPIPCTISKNDINSPYAPLILTHETCCSCAYLNSNDIPLIGLGFPLTPFKSVELTNVGSDYYVLITGDQALGETQIAQLFEDQINAAVMAVKAVIPNFDDLDLNVQQALVDMAYNMGQEGLDKLENLKKAIDDEDYNGAAQAVEDSSWCKQAKERCVTDVELLKTGVPSDSKSALDTLESTDYSDSDDYDYRDEDEDEQTDDDGDDIRDDYGSDDYDDSDDDLISENAYKGSPYYSDGIDDDDDDDDDDEPYVNRTYLDDDYFDDTDDDDDNINDGNYYANIDDDSDDDNNNGYDGDDIDDDDENYDALYFDGDTFIAGWGM